MDSPAVGVALVRWPEEADRRSRLAAQGAPRLLLVDPGEGPPSIECCLEDWIRLPAPDEETRARVEALMARASAHSPSAPVVPEMDAYDILRFGHRWVSLPPVEARMMRSFLERFGAVVSRQALARAGWPEGSPGRNALDVHVVRLRRRLDEVGLAIRTVRSRGYLLEPSESGQAPASQA